MIITILKISALEIMEIYGLALLGGGVCQFNPETGKKIFYTTSMGLANNMTYSILKDKIRKYVGIDKCRNIEN